MEVQKLGAVIEANDDHAGLAALRTQDFDDVAVVLRSSAIGRNGVDGVVEKDDRIGFGRVCGKRLGGRGTDPVGDGVGLRREGRSRVDKDEESESEAGACPETSAENAHVVTPMARKELP